MTSNEQTSPPISDDQSESVRKTSTILPPTDVKRKVSILTDQHSPEKGGSYYDNLAFEGRKISQQSDHSEDGTRKKSILHNPLTPEQQRLALQQVVPSDTIVTQPTHATLPNLNAVNDKLNGGDTHHRGKRHSTTSSLYSRHSRKSSRDEKLKPSMEGSWIYSLCLRCRAQYNTKSWQPKYWEKVCPYPLCPSYRQFARLLSIILIGVLIWATTYAILGDMAAPGGELFSLVTLTVAANFGGWLVGLTTLPRLIGMLFTGILMQNIGAVNIEGEQIEHVTDHLREFALTIILTRAGLEMDPEAFKKIWFTIIKLALVPWVAEAGIITVLSHYLLDLPWMWGLLLGSIIAAVSPAVVVPCLFRLRTKGYGVAKGIPTLIISIAGIDDAASVAIFGIVSSLMFSTDASLAFQISQAPVCIFGGLAFGVFWGYLSRIVPERGDAYVVPLRVLLLFTGGLLAIYGSELIHYKGAGPLAVVFAAFVSNYFWCKQGWDLEDNPVATAFEIFWMIFEPILFGITGAAVKFNELDSNVVIYGLASLLASGLLRALLTIGIAIGDKLNMKEKVFVSIAVSAKATVQAALGPIALTMLAVDSPDRHYAEIVLMVCILSIVLTAPLGAILISLTGTKLLSKTTQPQNVEGWRRSHRPSIRDISIIDEDEEKDLEADPELSPDKNTRNNTMQNAHSSNNMQQLPAFTITKF
ncbi:CLUMA_CG014448, isoform A [Clunio marinus]|uniref:CLUMA_CG014448, isoform A n=1 Tax=Clunio marinus TaxID=568069 RepID=A0A1J1IQE9_9DIPT|nr:CLUMA_CG014448, isoform A [Clunio marinus]